VGSRVVRGPGSPAAELRLDRLFRRVTADRSSSAYGLARRTLASLTSLTRSWPRRSPADVRRYVANVARGLERTQPAMGIFGIWAADWRRFTRTVPVARLPPAVSAWIRRRRDELEREPARVQRLVRQRIPPASRIVTISRSETVLSALRSLPASRAPREVLAMESLPGGEGRRLARDLRRAGIRARTIPDRAARTAVRAADLVMIGADAVEPDGAVVHKVGTRSLAVAARRVGVPVIVVAGRSKWVTAGRGRRHLPPLFERTPGSLVSAYWTDAGVIRGSGRHLHRPLSAGTRALRSRGG
jgi:translation initiation factor 2B subunit (eIF-2B alpha/beta/delta family)